MLCSKCKSVEMRMNKRKNDDFYFICPKCGGQLIKSIEELEKEHEEKEKQKAEETTESSTEEN